MQEQEQVYIDQIIISIKSYKHFKVIDLVHEHGACKTTVYILI